MSVEDDVARLAGMDQTDAAMRNMAQMIAVYWCVLIKEGLTIEAATELTRPLVIKMLGGNPE
jgi:hypothetical protein